MYNTEAVARMGAPVCACHLAVHACDRPSVLACRPAADSREARLKLHCSVGHEGGSREGGAVLLTVVPNNGRCGCGLHTRGRALLPSDRAWPVVLQREGEKKRECAREGWVFVCSARQRGRYSRHRPNSGPPHGIPSV